MNSPKSAHNHCSDETDSRLAELVSEIADRLSDGLAVHIDTYVEQYPEFEIPLRDTYASLHCIHQLSEQYDAASHGDAPQALGDFRLLREIGRGGMGVVYEALQLSLNRRVALKVLPFAAVLDDRKLQRFKNEAMSAAALKHPNIVGVHSVGSDRGVHYFAMEMVNGQSLAEVVAALGREEEAGNNVLSSADRDSSDNCGSIDGPVDRRLATDETRKEFRGVLSTARSMNRVEFHRSVARLGIQAADALDHAHQVGIVHRDIKPSNLLIDHQGKLWVTDFGLAMTHTSSNLTVSGDLVGTVRYMSAEQASGQNALVDHRTDIYSLGATLYELLTLKPVFGDADRRRLLHRIDTAEPVRPRKLDFAIPIDLETIVLKCLSKEITGRYTTAGELRDDLRNFLENRPIRATHQQLATHQTTSCTKSYCIIAGDRHSVVANNPHDDRDVFGTTASNSSPAPTNCDRMPRSWPRWLDTTYMSR